jgi:RNA polymerase sigma-70 factor (ECF subfamily)
MKMAAQIAMGSGGFAALHSAALLQGGDGRAVQNQHLIEPHIGSLRRYARALVRDADRADDLVHDCLERALSRWHLWRGEGNLRAWLFTILHNVHVNNVRRDMAAGRPVQMPDGIELRATPASQDHHLMLNDLAAAMTRLPDEQRETVLLVGLEGFSYREVARITGVPIGTVMSRLSRGRERLRELIAGPDESKIRKAK